MEGDNELPKVCTASPSGQRKVKPSAFPIAHLLAILLVVSGCEQLGSRDQNTIVLHDVTVIDGKTPRILASKREAYRTYDTEQVWTG